MLGLLIAYDGAQRMYRVLRAFSGQLLGQWEREGFVPPVFSVSKWTALERRFEPEIRNLTLQIRAQAEAGAASSELRALRRARSRELFDAYLDLYLLRSSEGDVKGLRSLWPGERPPGGAGDCCAPKLLQEAFRRGLQPISMTEFYWGAIEARAIRTEGTFYPPCQRKCGPILDFIWGRKPSS